MDSESTKEPNGGCVNNNNNHKPSAVASLDGVKVEEEKRHANNGKDDCDSKTLLPPRKGGISRKSERKRCSSRKVQWNDKNGNKLAEVLEYMPSDVSDSEDDANDSCICSIM